MRTWMRLLAVILLLTTTGNPPPTRRRHAHRRAGRPRRRTHRDGGNILVFEAVVLALLFMTSVAIVTTLPGPSLTPSIDPARGPLEAQVKDLLVAMEDIPTSDRYQTVMQRAIAKAVQGNTTAFENLIDRAMPPGAECRLWLDNGHGRRLMAGPSERLARESVSRSVLWRPTWAYGFVLPTLDLVSELQPLPLQGYQVAQGSLVKEHGVPLVATLSTDQGTYERAALTAVRPGPTASLYLLDELGQPGFAYRDQVLTWVTSPLHNKTAAGPLGGDSFIVPYGQQFLNLTAFFRGAAPLGLPLASVITFRDDVGGEFVLPVAAPDPVPAFLSIASPRQGNWTYTTDDNGNSITSARLYVNASAQEGNRNWSIVLKEEGTGTLPEGTKLTVTLPSVFTMVDATARNQSGWRNVTAADDLDAGATVSAELDSVLSGGQRVLSVEGRRPANGDALYDVTATLSQGASARSTFVLGSTAGLVSTANPIEHELYLSVPKPTGPGGTATWGVAFPYPKSVVGLGEGISAMDLRVADGTPLFQGLVGLSPNVGWQLVSPTHLRWNGTLTVMPNEAADFVFRVTVSENRTPDEPGIHLPIQFPANTHPGSPPATNFSLLDQERPYIHALNVPPAHDILGNAQKGYHRPSGAPNERSNTSLNTTGVVRGMLVDGSASYGVTNWGTVTTLAEATRNGLGKSHLTLSKPAVKIEEEFQLTVDFDGLFDEIKVSENLTVTGWNVSAFIYDPAQPFAGYAMMVPSFQGRWGSNLQLLVELPEFDAIETYAHRSANILTRAFGSINLSAPRGAFYGPHAVVAQADFIVRDLVENKQMLQSARLLGALEVIPDGGQSASALYWATLECWLPDW